MCNNTIIIGFLFDYLKKKKIYYLSTTTFLILFNIILILKICIYFLEKYIHIFIDFFFFTLNISLYKISKNKKQILYFFKKLENIYFMFFYELDFFIDNFIFYIKDNIMIYRLVKYFNYVYIYKNTKLININNYFNLKIKLLEFFIFKVFRYIDFFLEKIHNLI